MFVKRICCSKWKRALIHGIREIKMFLFFCGETLPMGESERMRESEMKRPEQLVGRAGWMGKQFAFIRTRKGIFGSENNVMLCCMYTSFVNHGGTAKTIHCRIRNERCWAECQHKQIKRSIFVLHIFCCGSHSLPHSPHTLVSWLVCPCPRWTVSTSTIHNNNINSDGGSNRQPEKRWQQQQR